MPRTGLLRKAQVVPLPKAGLTATVKSEQTAPTLPVEMAVRIGALEAAVADLRPQVLVARLREQEVEMQLRMRHAHELELRRQLAERLR